MFQPGWKMTGFTVLFAPMLFWLGHWQLDREQEKIQLQHEYDARVSAAPLQVEKVQWEQKESLGFLKIVSVGQYDNQHTYLLDNKIVEGKVGYEILSPFTTENGLHLLINRGWIPMGATRTQLPEVTPIIGTVTIQGSVYVPLEEAFLLNAEEEISETQGLTVLQSIDMEKLARSSGSALAPYTIRLLAGSPGAERVNWQVVNMLPEKHRAYAVQWFALLAALIGMFIYFGFKNPQYDQK